MPLFLKNNKKQEPETAKNTQCLGEIGKYNSNERRHHQTNKIYPKTKVCATMLVLKQLTPFASNS